MLHSWFSCPNPRRLRTSFSSNPEKLSEPWATSDKFQVKSRKVVRTLGYFGQVSCQIPISCPNPGLLRTSFSSNPEKLSEPWATSDRFQLKSRKVVRTLGYFGQVSAQIPISCPNPRLLRTKFHVKFRKLVRTLGYFGQVSGEILKSCPNTSGLRTERLLL